MLGNKVSWREEGKVYKVRMDGKVESGEGSDWIDRFGENLFRRFRGRSNTRIASVQSRDEEQS